MGFQRKHTINRDRIARLRERIASLKEENASVKQKERDLEDAKQQIFRASLQAEKQRELALLALKRTVSRKCKSLEVHNQRTHNSFSSQSVLTYSVSSINDDVSGQDSGFQIDEMQGLNEEKRELKLENAKLQSELLDMKKTIENLTVTIDKKEKDLQGSKNKSKMLEDHSSLLALHAYELSERRELLEDELELREKEFNDMKVKNTEAMRKLEEEYTIERRRNAVRMNEIKETAAVLEKMNDQLREELKERDLDNQAKGVVSSVICNSLEENFNENLGQCLKSTKNLEHELALMKSKVVHQETQMAKSVSKLEESKIKCQMYKEKVSTLTFQLDDVKKAVGILENELLLKDKQIEAMQIRSTDEITRLADETNEKIMKEVMKNESLEQEVARYRISQAELQEKVQEQQLLLTSKLVTFDVVLNPMATTCENEAVKYQEEIQEMEMKVGERDDRYSSILEKACLLDLEQLNTRYERMDMNDECYTKGQQLSKGHEEVVNEQDGTISNSHDFKSNLKCSSEKCCKLEEANKGLEAQVEQLQFELDSREQKIKEMDEKLKIFNEELQSKEITIGQLSMKKAKRRGLRRFICCGS